MKKLLLALSMTVAVSGAVAQSKDGVYGEVSFASLSVKDKSDAEMGTFKPSAIKLTLGKEVHSNLAVEAVVGNGISGDDKIYSDTTITLKAKEFYGVYARPFVKLNEQVELFARAGYLHAKLEASASGTSISDSGSDFSYGAGAAFSLTKTTAITADYMKYYSKNEMEISGFSLGLRYKF